MIVITGTPGTGKTVVAEKLGKRLGLPVKHVNELVKGKKLFTGVEGDSLVVDLDALKRELGGFDGIVEGHVLCELVLNAKLAIVLRTEPRELEKRLREKGFGKEKIRENLEAEALDYCAIKARQRYARVEDVDTTGRAVEESVGKVIQVLDGEKGDSVDWSDFFLS